MTNAKRMSDERRIDIGRHLSECATEPVTQGWRGIVEELLAHIDALAADLERATRVEDVEVAEFVQWLRLEASEPSRDAGTVWRFVTTANLLTCLSQALASAERDRDYLKNWRAEAEGTIIKATTAAVQSTERAETAEAQLREAREAMRIARCPSDGRHLRSRHRLVGECYDAKSCGCTIGLHFGAKPNSNP